MQLYKFARAQLWKMVE